MKNYLGTEPIISRAVGRAEDWIRTETLPSWLNGGETARGALGTERAGGGRVPRLRLWDLRPQVSPAPAFVAAVALRPAEWGGEDGDDEIYFFFTETSRAFDSYERIKVPRVARVCAVRP